MFVRASEVLNNWERSAPVGLPSKKVTYSDAGHDVAQVLLAAPSRKQLAAELDVKCHALRREHLRVAERVEVMKATAPVTLNHQPSHAYLNHLHLPPPIEPASPPTRSRALVVRDIPLVAHRLVLPLVALLARKHRLATHARGINDAQQAVKARLLATRARRHIALAVLVRYGRARAAVAVVRRACAWTRARPARDARGLHGAVVRAPCVPDATRGETRARRRERRTGVAGHAERIRAVVACALSVRNTRCKEK